jgi:hypothetical protein
MVDDHTGLRVLRAAGVTCLLLAATTLSGCSAGAPEPAPSTTATASPRPTATEEPPPALDPAGDAEANIDFFDTVNRALLKTVDTPNGQQIVDNLVAAGFAKADMEITPDVTVGDEAAETIQFSVRINGTCLVGQTGAAGYNAVAAPLLGTGKCLVGATRTIDW